MSKLLQDGNFKKIKRFPKYAINEKLEVVNLTTGKILKRQRQRMSVALYNNSGERYTLKLETLYRETFFENYKEVFLKENDAVVIEGFSNYAINKKGEVFNLTHFKKIKGHTRSYKGYFYHTVTMREDCGFVTLKFVSHIMAEMFLDNDQGKYNVGFKDGNKLNLDLDNLFWK